MTSVNVYKPQSGTPVAVRTIASENYQLMGNGLVPEAYDEQVLNYNGSGDVTSIVYKLAGTTVGTVTYGYSAGNVVSIVRT